MTTAWAVQGPRIAGTGLAGRDWEHVLKERSETFARDERFDTRQHDRLLSAIYGNEMDVMVSSALNRRADLEKARRKAAALAYASRPGGVVKRFALEVLELGDDPNFADVTGKAVSGWTGPIAGLAKAGAAAEAAVEVSKRARTASAGTLKRHALHGRLLDAATHKLVHVPEHGGEEAAFVVPPPPSRPSSRSRPRSAAPAAFLLLSGQEAATLGVRARPGTPAYPSGEAVVDGSGAFQPPTVEIPSHRGHLGGGAGPSTAGSIRVVTAGRGSPTSRSPSQVWTTGSVWDSTPSVLPPPSPLRDQRSGAFAISPAAEIANGIPWAPRFDQATEPFRKREPDVERGQARLSGVLTTVPTRAYHGGGELDRPRTAEVGDFRRSVGLPVIAMPVREHKRAAEVAAEEGKGGGSRPVSPARPSASRGEGGSGGEGIRRSGSPTLGKPFMSQGMAIRAPPAAVPWSAWSTPVINGVHGLLPAPSPASRAASPNSRPPSLLSSRALPSGGAFNVDVRAFAGTGVDPLAAARWSRTDRESKTGEAVLRAADVVRVTRLGVQLASSNPFQPPLRVDEAEHSPFRDGVSYRRRYAQGGVVSGLSGHLPERSGRAVSPHPRPPSRYARAELTAAALPSAAVDPPLFVPIGSTVDRIRAEGLAALLGAALVQQGGRARTPRVDNVKAALVGPPTRGSKATLVGQSLLWPPVFDT
jgi:hypothetical protein